MGLHTHDSLASQLSTRDALCLCLVSRPWLPGRPSPLANPINPWTQNNFTVLAKECRTAIWDIRFWQYCISGSEKGSFQFMNGKCCLKAICGLGKQMHNSFKHILAVYSNYLSLPACLRASLPITSWHGQLPDHGLSQPSTWATQSIAPATLT